MPDPINAWIRRVRDRRLAQTIAHKPDLLRELYALMLQERAKSTPPAIISDLVRGVLVRAQVRNKTAGALAIQLVDAYEKKSRSLVRSKRRNRMSETRQKLFELVKTLRRAGVPQNRIVDMVADQAMKYGVTRQSAYPMARELLGMPVSPVGFVRFVQGGRVNPR